MFSTTISTKFRNTTLPTQVPKNDNAGLSDNTPYVIAGSVIGGLVAAGGAAALFFYRRRASILSGTTPEAIADGVIFDNPLFENPTNYNPLYDEGSNSV